jgi:hypothetical protein
MYRYPAFISHQASGNQPGAFDAGCACLITVIRRLLQWIRNTTKKTARSLAVLFIIAQGDVRRG